MIIDSARLNGPCSCGREHVMVTKEAVIEAGCMEKLDFYAAKYGLTAGVPWYMTKIHIGPKTSSVPGRIRKLS